MQGIEPVPPQCAVFLQPLIDLDERLRPQAVDPPLRLLAYVDEPGLPQNPHVPGHARPSDRQRVGQLADLAGELPVRRGHQHVGARKREILDVDDEEIDPELELETGVCYFNDLAYPLGSYVLSGDELLHCEERGVWVRKGEIRPD